MDEVFFDVLPERIEGIIKLAAAIEICEDEEVRPYLLKTMDAAVWSITPNKKEGTVLQMVKNEAAD